jgi:hypothetical protein
MPFVSPLMLGSAQTKRAVLRWEGVDKQGTASFGPFSYCSGITILSDSFNIFNGLFETGGSYYADFNNDYIGSDIKMTIQSNNYSSTMSPGTVDIFVAYTRDYVSSTQYVIDPKLQLMDDDVALGSGTATVTTIADANGRGREAFTLWWTTSSNTTTGSVTGSCDIIFEVIE